MKNITRIPKKPIMHYITKGPRAVDKRLKELERESRHLKSRLSNISIIRTCMKAIGFGKMTPKVRTLLRTLGSRTLAEIKNEKLALQALFGRDLHIWEVR
jgi:hypothetical protein